MQHQACNAVDIHTHVVPATFPRSLQGVAGWPSMEPTDSCHRNIVIDGKLYRTVSDACWNIPKRIAEMDTMGVHLQVVSPMPELFSYWLPFSAANDLLRYINDQTAEAIAASHGRLAGLAAVPLQDIDLAIAELTRACKHLGFAGVELGSNINGIPIGAPQFDPFFAAAEDLGAAIFVHAVKPTGMDRLVGPAALQQVLAYPTDVGLAAASIITSNTITRFPRLRIAFSHGGGTLASLLPRLAEGVRVFPALQDSITEDVYAQAQRFFYDTLVYDEPTLRHLLAVFGDTQLLVGTDYPFNFHERHPLQRIDAAVADQDIRLKLRASNSSRFLNLETPR